MSETTTPDAWQPEEDDEDDGINAENITPEVPQELYKSFVWDALKIAHVICETKDDVIRKAKRWNLKNNPKLPESSLVKMAYWTFKNWDTKFGNPGII